MLWWRQMQYNQTIELYAYNTDDVQVIVVVGS